MEKKVVVPMGMDRVVWVRTRAVMLTKWQEPSEALAVRRGKKRLVAVSI